MYATITISNVGADVGPFDLYSNLDGFVSAFDTDISTAQLQAGFFTGNIPDGTTSIRIKSNNEVCGSFELIGTTPLLYYFIPSDSQFDDRYLPAFIDNGTTAYAYGAFKGYWNGDYEVPGNMLVKLNPDLSVDTTFDVGSGFNDHVTYIGAELTKLNDGSIILVGFFTSYDGTPRNRIIKLDKDGTINPLFNVGTGFNNYTTGISQTTDDKYYITGIYSTYNGVAAYRIIKLLNDGSIDISFVTGTGFNNSTLSTLTDFQNKVYVSGYYSTYKGVTRNGIVKLNLDGSVDESFVVGTGFQPRGTYRGVLMNRIPGEEKIVCITYCTNCSGGLPNQTTYQGVNYGNIVKLNTDGTVDAEFAANSGTGFNGECSLIDIVFGDKLLIQSTSPSFTEYNGVPTIGMALLNADGTLLQAFPQYYGWVYAIGNNLYGTDLSGPYPNENQLIYTYVPGATTTTTTTTTV